MKNLHNYYTINYFNEKKVTYYGTLEGAKAYAEEYMSRYLTLSCIGSIQIMDGNKVVAEQEWRTGCDEVGEYAEPLEWK